MLALALVTLRWVLPRLMNLQPGGGKGRLRLLESLALDRQHRVALLRAGDREYLLGLGSGRVTAIDWWPSRDVQPAADPAASAEPRETLEVSR